MAHELNFRNGKASMFYTNEAPWHGLGTRLDKPATAGEAINAAGLGYWVETQPVYLEGGIPIAGWKATVRSDTNQCLGVVSNEYRPIQNKEAFRFMDGLVGEGLEYHTAGALGKGERIWMLAKIPGVISLAGGEDISEKYLLLTNAHNGLGALSVLFTGIRVVCANTWRRALDDAGESGVRIQHTGNVQDKLEEARRVLGLAHIYFEKLGEQARALSSHLLNTTELQAYFKTVLPPIEREEAIILTPGQRGANTRRENIWGEWERLFTEGQGHDLPGVRGTLWAAYNAVTEYVDHRLPGSQSDIETRQSSRLNSVWFGTGAALKARAFESALTLTV